MKLDNEGKKFIKSWEGFRATPYLCTGGVPTIGWGTTKGITMKHPAITREQADQWFDRDIRVFENAVNKAVKVDLNQHQFNALVSFTYNVGVGALQNSTLLRVLNERAYLEAADQFLRWNKSGGKVTTGLVRRRNAERDLFLKTSF